MPTRTYNVEDYFLDNNEKIVKIILDLKDNKKRPIACDWFGNKVPAYTNSNKHYALNIFNNQNYRDYQSIHNLIEGHNCIAIDTNNIYQIDFDTIDDVTKNYLIDLGLPYFESYGKRLPHFIFRDTTLRPGHMYHKFTTSTGGYGDILTGQWSFSRPDAVLYNYGKSFNNNDFIDFDIQGSGLFKIETPIKIFNNTKMNRKIIEPLLDICNNIISNDKLAEISECLDIEKRLNTKGCYEYYRNIVWALASVNEYDLAKKICMKGDKLYDEKDFKKTYNSFMADGGITLAIYYKYCKEDNPDLYNSFFLHTYSGVAVTLLTSHHLKAHAIFENYGEYFIFMDNVLYFWSDDHNKWFCDTHLYFTKHFITLKLKEWGEAEEDETDKWDEVIDSKGKVTKKISDNWKWLQSCIHNNQQVAEKEQIVKSFKEFLNTRNDNIKMDDKPYLIAFRNKIYDFKNNCFREQKKDDYISMNCNYNWVEPTEKQMDLITLLIERIFPNPEIRKCYMSVLYNGCIGFCPEKFIIANGDGRNGKGLINDLIRMALGDYAYEGNSSTLCEKLREGANPEVANFHKKRFITFAEPDTTNPINTATMKKLSGGGVLNARQLYCGKTNTILEAIIVVEANEKPALNGTDSDSIALKERMRDILFESSFTATCDEEVDISNNIFKQNPYYKTTEFQTEHKCALLKYIMNYGNIEKIYTPECVAERSNEYLLINDSVYGFVTDNIIPQQDSWVKIKDLFEMFKHDDIYINMTKICKRKYNLTYFRNTIQKHTMFRKYYKEKYQYDGTSVHNILINFTFKEKYQDDPENI